MKRIYTAIDERNDRAREMAEKIRNQEIKGESFKVDGWKFDREFKESIIKDVITGVNGVTKTGKDGISRTIKPGWGENFVSRKAAKKVTEKPILPAIVALCRNKYDLERNVNDMNYNIGIYADRYKNKEDVLNGGPRIGEPDKDYHYNPDFKPELTKNGARGGTHENSETLEMLKGFLFGTAELDSDDCQNLEKYD